MQAMDQAPSTSADDRFAPIKVLSAYEMVAAAIEREILAGALGPGDALGTEADLSRQFSVNRSTVREGIRMLEQSGLVERRAGRRLVVTRPQPRSLSNRVARALVLHDVTFAEVFEAALVLEVGTAEQAALRATPEDLAALEANHALAREARDDFERLAALDVTFHRLVARATHNRVLEMARESPSLLFMPTTAVICAQVPEASGRLLEAHEALMECFRRKDSEAAGRWMRRHVSDWYKGFRRTGRDPEAPVERALAVAATTTM